MKQGYYVCHKGKFSVPKENNMSLVLTALMFAFFFILYIFCP